MSLFTQTPRQTFPQFASPPTLHSEPNIISLSFLPSFASQPPFLAHGSLFCKLHCKPAFSLPRCLHFTLDQTSPSYILFFVLQTSLSSTSLSPFSANSPANPLSACLVAFISAWTKHLPSLSSLPPSAHTFLPQSISFSLHWKLHSKPSFSLSCSFHFTLDQTSSPSFLPSSVPTHLPSSVHLLPSPQIGPLSIPRPPDHRPPTPDFLPPLSHAIQFLLHSVLALAIHSARHSSEGTYIQFLLFSFSSSQPGKHPLHLSLS